MPFEETGFGAIGGTAVVLLITSGHCQPVHHQEPGPFRNLLLGQDLFDAMHRSAIVHACVPLLLQDVEVFLQRAASWKPQRCEHQHYASFREGVHARHDIFDRVAAHLSTRDRRNGMACASEE